MRIAFLVSEDFNLGVAYLIAYLKSIDNEVRLFFYNRGIRFRPEYLLGYDPDLVCFSCVTANFEVACKIAQVIESKLPFARILFGGVHPTLCPEDVTKRGYEVCEGDGIEFFGGKFDPDSLWPDREIFFKQLPKVHREYQIFMTGFGCPFRCSYCNSHQLQKKIIKRSVEGCIKELEDLKQKGLRYVLFVDDIFTINRKWLIDFTYRYKYFINLPYTCFAHVKYVDEEVCHVLKESGCECVWIGIQSGDEKTRREILNRFETNEKIKTACELIKGNGLRLIIDHIFGLPNDTYEKLLTSFEFYKTLKPDVVDCNELLYFPKAEINKFGSGKAKYEKQGGQDFKRYAKSFTSIPLFVN